MIIHGDCVEVMRGMDAETVDAIVTDPPYGLEFMGKAWDGFGTPLGFQTWTEQWAREALRVLKPGGHLLAFGGTRMYHRLAAGIEDAGFEIRDTLMWLYGSGFPKSLDVSKAIDKAAGAEREVIGSRPLTGNGKTMKSGFHQPDGTGAGETVKEHLHMFTAPATDAAKKWQGWGTALKPAVEPIVLARKPLIGTVADNVLKHGTGALNIDASRIGTEKRALRDARNTVTPSQFGSMGGSKAIGETNLGRWPANILLDEAAAAMLDEQSGNLAVNKVAFYRYRENGADGPSVGLSGTKYAPNGYGDSGGASRFFYVAKASRAERNKGLERNIHPTVKPVQLMRYLIRLVAHKDAVILDPFLGSGTTAVAAIEEGVKWIGCERESEYVEIAKARVAATQPGIGLGLD